MAWHARHRFLWSFAVLSLFMGISVGLAKVTTSLYALQLGASGWWLGAIASAQSVGILITALPVGVWVERFGPRLLFMAGCLAGGLLYALLPLVPHAAFLLGMTVLTGLVMPTRFVSLQTIFMAMLQQIGPSNAGWQRAAHMSGMLLLGPLLTASVIAHLGHTGSYWLVALMFLLTVALSQRVLRQPLPAPTAPLAPRPPGIRAAMAQVLAHPQARRLALTEACVQGLNMYHAFFIVVIAVQDLHVPAAAAGSLVAVQGAAFILAAGIDNLDGGSTLCLCVAPSKARSFTIPPAALANLPSTLIPGSYYSQLGIAFAPETEPPHVKTRGVGAIYAVPLSVVSKSVAIP